MSHEFPEPPPHFYRFAWRGIPLILPDSWHLRLHEGSDRRGALVFSDLRQTQLELRWQTPANIFPRQKNTAQRLLEKTLARLLQKRPAAAVARLAPNAAQFQLSEKSVVLIAADGGTTPPRLFELSCPLTPESPHVALIINDLLESLPRAAEHPAQFWSVYGAQGWIPPRFRLRKLSLLPGSVTLTFTRRGFLGLLPKPQRHHEVTKSTKTHEKYPWDTAFSTAKTPIFFPFVRLRELRGFVVTSFRIGQQTLLGAAGGNSITLGSVSLADRLLAQHRSLQTWAAAAFPLLQRLPAGTWEESPTTLTFTAPDRRLLRTRRHTLELHHDPPTNQIRWTHRTWGHNPN